MKRCSVCGAAKDATSFHKDKRTASGLKSECKACSSAYYFKNKTAIAEKAKVFAKRHPDRLAKRRRNAQLRYLYGISLKQYSDMLAAQDNACAICGKPEAKRSYWGSPLSLAVDHSHKTNKVRKLLCRRCNLVVGQVDEDITLLRKLVNYLEHENN